MKQLRPLKGEPISGIIYSVSRIIRLREYAWLAFRYEQYLETSFFVFAPDQNNVLAVLAMWCLRIDRLVIPAALKFEGSCRSRIIPNTFEWARWTVHSETASRKLLAWIPSRVFFFNGRMSFSIRRKHWREKCSYGKIISLSSCRTYHQQSQLANDGECLRKTFVWI